MEGFFTRKETESASRPDGKTYSCVSCGLYGGCQNPKMKPYGNFKKGILIIGEAPGEVEDEKGKPWQGKTGRLLQSTCKKLGIDIFEDCLNINAVYCRPTDEHGNNRTPSNYEIECCRRTTLKIIRERKPKLILLLGNSAVFSLIGHRWKKDLGGINKWRGWRIPDQDFQCWICPTFHPSFVERADLQEVETIWKTDLQAAFDLVCSSDPQPFPKYKEPEIKMIEDLSILRKIKDGTITAFDYETTGIKPHAKGHRIVCVSIATSPDEVYQFFMPPTRSGRQPLLEYLINPRILKMAHNMKFEDTWSKIRMGVDVQGWEWDSMLAAHLLDNRPEITGLKFQSYVLLGIVDYASEISPYLQAVDPKNGNSLNRILELIANPDGRMKLGKYNALDSINEYRVAGIQRDQIILPF